jgi:hypothetical protein
MSTTSSSHPTNQMMELATSINIDNATLNAALTSALKPRTYSSVELLELATNIKFDDLTNLALSSIN